MYIDIKFCFPLFSEHTLQKMLSTSQQHRRKWWRRELYSWSSSPRLTTSQSNWTSSRNTFRDSVCMTLYNYVTVVNIDITDCMNCPLKGYRTLFAHELFMFSFFFFVPLSILSLQSPNQVCRCLYRSRLETYWCYEKDLIVCETVFLGRSRPAYIAIQILLLGRPAYIILYSYCC